MLKIFVHIGSLILFSALVAVGVSAQVALNGELGVDFENFGFASDLKDTVRYSESSRNSTSHFLNLFSTGPLGTDRFAAYSSRVKLSGIYFKSTSNNEKESDYINPEISIFNGSTTLFPKRSYPLKVYYSRDKNYPLRLEENNKSNQSRLRPTLSVTRRYENDLTSRGSQFQFFPNESWNIVSEYKNEQTKASRIYDFSENNDIWIQSYRTEGRPWDSVFSVSFLNDTKDSISITVVNLDSLYGNGNPLTVIFDNIPPLHSVAALLPQGLIEVNVDSRRYNPHTFQAEIDGHFSFGVVYEDPEAPNDLDQERTVFSSNAKYKSNGKFENESYLEYSDQKEAYQNQTTYLTNMSNIANYKFSKDLILDILTNYSKDQTIIVNTSTQKNSSLMNQTTLSYKKRRGIAANFIHAYNRNKSEVEVDSTTSTASTMNNFLSQITMPFNKYNYRIDFKNSATLLSDDNDLVNNQYSSEIINAMSMMFKGIEVRPSMLFKYVYTYLENPDQTSTQIETKFTLDNHKYTKTFGDIRLKGEYTYRTRDKKDKYFLDMSVIKKFGKTYKLSLLSTQEWASYGGPTIGGRATRPSEYKSSYRVDIKYTPSINVNLGSNYMIISQKGTKIQKFGANLIVIIPKLDMPVKSFVLAEFRDLEGRPRQSQFTMETKISYQIRKISLILSHSYKFENQLFVDHSSHEVMARISRQFNVL